MENESSEDCFQSATEDDEEEPWKPVSSDVINIPDEISENLSLRIQKVSPKLDKKEKVWIVANYHSFASAEEMLQSEECKNITRRQSKILKPILDDVIAKTYMQARSSYVMEAVKCEKSTADWVCEKFDTFTEIKDLLDSVELDDLTRRQLEILEKVLNSSEFIRPKNYLNETKRIVMLKNRIHETTRLKDDLCYWIAHTWVESESLEEIFERKELENITRRKQKELSMILHNDTKMNPPWERQNEVQELVEFAKASNFEISDAFAKHLIKLRGKKYDIGKIVEVLKEDTSLEVYHKFELLKFLLITPYDTIQKCLLETSKENRDLRHELEKLLKMYKVNENLASKLRDKFYSFQSAEDLDQFEDLTEKESKAFKESLGPHLKNFVELKRSLSNVARDNASGQILSLASETDTQVDPQTFDCKEKILEVVENVQKNKTEDDGKSWPEIERDAVLSVQGPSSEIVGSQNSLEHKREDIGQMFFQETNDNQPSVKKISANTFPLITCKKISQGDSVVEKFSVRADYVKDLCNFDEKCPRFCKDVSSGLMIDFSGLNEFKMGITGLFGRSENAKLFLEKRLDEDSFIKFQKIIASEGSGMYFVLANEIAAEEASHSFLYFFSKNDEDYDDANPKSKSVHFFRYITQLTKDIILLFDETDYHQLMSEKPQEDFNQKNRCRKYQIKKLECQKEQISFDELSFVDVCWTQQQKIFASNVGLLLVKTSVKKSCKDTWLYQGIEGAFDFKKHFSLSQITENAEICEEFMEDYISEIHNNQYRQCKELWEMKKLVMLKDKSTQFFCTLDFALVLRLYEEAFLEDFLIIKEFFLNFYKPEMSDIIQNLKQHWKEAIDVDFDTTKALTLADKKSLLEVMNTECSDLSLSEFILKEVLTKKTGKKPPANATTKQLLSLVQAQQKSIFGRFVSFFDCKGKANQEIAETQILKANLQLFINECEIEQPQFQYILCGVFQKLRQFSVKQVTWNRTLCKYVSYRQENLDHLVENNVAIEKSRIIKECFFTILQDQKISSLTEPSPEKEENTGAEKLITKIIKYSPKSNTVPKKFRVYHSVVSKNCKKTHLEIEKVSLRKEQIHEAGPNSFIFGSPSSIEIPQCEVVGIDCIDASFVLLLLNNENLSSAEIYSLNSCNRVCRIGFGKRICLYDFDVSKRLLCVYSERSQEADIHLYQFSPDFKSHTNFGSYDLKARYSIDSLQAICLQYSSKYLWVLERKTGRIIRLDNKNGNNASPEKLATSKLSIGKVMFAKMSPDGQCIFLTNEANETFPLMTGTCNLLPKLDYSMTDKYLFIQQELKQTLIAEKKEKGLELRKISISGAQQEIKLQETGHTVSRNQSTGFSETNDLKKVAKEHWVCNFYWMFVKFPCENLFQETGSLQFSSVCRNVPESFQACVKLCLKNILENLRATKKPAKLFTSSIKFYQESAKFHVPLKTKNIQKMGDFIHKLICFTPLQVARCQANEFLILNDGLPMPLENVEDVFDLKENIDLGLFEAVLNNWTGPVKVVSSMGKQTTGKSYLLNHLMGSSFNISGTRCTDGCWMTVEVVKDCLYVILDFEGLGSFERTDQDDMLLSLFNSSLATMTLFKTEQRLDRDTDQLFSKFNLGSDQLRCTDKIFQGTFMIIVKDVAESDIEDIRKEFTEKINALLHKEKQNNFISKLYQGGFQINSFSPFQTSSFYNDIHLLRDEILAIEPLFTDGHAFMDLMKLMLAKLAINDFTPVDRQQIDLRIKYLKNHLSNALKYGQLCDETTKKPEYALKLLDKTNERVPTKWILKLPEVSLQSFEMNDDDLLFAESSFMSIVGIFNEFMVQDASNFTKWRSQLELFLEECLKNRIERVDFWINENVSLWKKQDVSDYDDAISALKDSCTLEKNNLRRSMKFCSEKCSKCFVKCTRLAGHISDHHCSTSHLCTENCFYCTEEIRSCKHFLGHDNDHVCKEIEHLCGKKCSFQVKNNCPNECALMSNHVGDHMCSLKVHICSSKCSLETCSSSCKMDCLVDHEIHKCSKEQCMADCCVENCRNICSAKDHFHGFLSLSASYRQQQKMDENEALFTKTDGSQLFSDDHFCGNEHSCGLECVEDGYCEVSVEKQFEEKEEIFKGRRSTFKYKQKFVQIGKKLPCLRKIMAFEKSHEGGHSCTTKAKIHCCMDKCPTCENICDKPFNHQATQDRLHHTSHGNMTKCHFICNQEDFNVGDHKYVVGEQAMAEFCHLFCNSLGRGHIHVLDCPGKCEQHFDIEHDHRRHETCKYGPNKDVPKDEIWHSAYWDHIGFQDPCTGAELEVFEKCPYFCSAPSHKSDKLDEVDDLRSYCMLDLWHKPVKDLAEVGFDFGSVSNDGHLFACYHEIITYHWVLLLDKSGSMNGQPWLDVVESTLSLMKSRGSVSSAEKYSVIVYDHDAYIGEEFGNVTAFDQQSLSIFGAGGGTDFSVALSTADQLISRHLDGTCIPVLVFMSDGGSKNGDVEMTEIARKYKVNHKLKVYTLGFGNLQFKKLKQLATIGGGKFIKCIEGIDLKHTFIQIASEAPTNVGVTSCK